MALKLGGASDSTIMRVGQWTSLTYVTYIHTQIGALTAGLALENEHCFHVPNLTQPAKHTHVVWREKLLHIATHTLMTIIARIFVGAGHNLHEGFNNGLS
jgi:hypothetical protein